MSDTDAALTGAGVPVILGGKEFLMASLRDVDFVELDEWVRQRVMTTGLSGLKAVTDARTRNEVISQVTETASAATWMSGYGAKMLATVDGVSRLLWQSLKKYQPNVTHAELRELMFDRQNVTTVLSTFNRINKFKFPGAAKKGPQESPTPQPPTAETPSTNNSSNDST